MSITRCICVEQTKTKMAPLLLKKSISKTKKKIMTVRSDHSLNQIINHHQSGTRMYFLNRIGRRFSGISNAYSTLAVDQIVFVVTIKRKIIDYNYM